MLGLLVPAALSGAAPDPFAGVAELRAGQVAGRPEAGAGAEAHAVRPGRAGLDRPAVTPSAFAVQHHGIVARKLRF